MKSKFIETEVLLEGHKCIRQIGEQDGYMIAGENGLIWRHNEGACTLVLRHHFRRDISQNSKNLSNNFIDLYFESFEIFDLSRLDEKIQLIEVPLTAREMIKCAENFEAYK